MAQVVEVAKIGGFVLLVKPVGGEFLPDFSQPFGTAALFNVAVLEVKNPLIKGVFGNIIELVHPDHVILGKEFPGCLPYEYLLLPVAEHELFMGVQPGEAGGTMVHV